MNANLGLLSLAIFNFVSGGAQALPAAEHAITADSSAKSGQSAISCPKHGEHYEKKPEGRGVWISNIGSQVLYSPRFMTKAFDRLRAWNMNTVYPAVWNQGSVFFSQGETQAALGTPAKTLYDMQPDGSIKQGDVLQGVIDEAHDKSPRVDVSPWFEYGLSVPADAPLVKQHPDWLTSRQNGSQTTKFGSGDALVMLNPFNPDAQDFMVQMVKDVVDNYDVDGIQLDDHFSLPVDFGYDKYTAALYNEDQYRKAHGGKGPSEADKARIDALPLPNKNTPAWKRWRADKITELMGRIAKAVRTSKHPHAKITVACNAQGYAYNNFLQDWGAWISKGYVDEFILQDYVPKNFATELKNSSLVNAAKCVPVRVAILAGIGGAKPTPPVRLLQSQVQSVRAAKYDGVDFFSYNYLINGPSGESVKSRSDGIAKVFGGQTLPASPDGEY